MAQQERTASIGRSVPTVGAPTRRTMTIALLGLKPRTDILSDPQRLRSERSGKKVREAGRRAAVAAVTGSSPHSGLTSPTLTTRANPDLTSTSSLTPTPSL